MMFGDGQIDHLTPLREAAEQYLGDMLSKGMIGIDKVPGITKLICSNDKQNIKLAINLLRTHAEQFAKSKVLDLQQKRISKR